MLNVYCLHTKKKYPHKKKMILWEKKEEKKHRLDLGLLAF